MYRRLDKPPQGAGMMELYPSINQKTSGSSEPKCQGAVTLKMGPLEMTSSGVFGWAALGIGCLALAALANRMDTMSG